MGKFSKNPDLRDQNARGAVDEHRSGRRHPKGTWEREKSKFHRSGQILQTILYFTIYLPKEIVQTPLKILNISKLVIWRRGTS